MTVTYPTGYGTIRVTMERLKSMYEPRMHPEFARRLFPWIEAQGGFIGIGSGFRSSQPTGPTFAPAGKSFHLYQHFTGQGDFYTAVDLVAWRGNGVVHRSPRWSEVPYQGEDEAARWGVHCNVGGPSGAYDWTVAYKGEPWHMQPIELDGWGSWNNAGKPGLQIGYPIPGTGEAPPPAPPPNPEQPTKPTPSPGGTVQVNPVTLKPGAADVNWTEKLQAIMPTFGQDVGPIDGDYGPKTQQAVWNCQVFFGLTADKICGPQTWSILLGIAP